LLSATDSVCEFRKLQTGLDETAAMEIGTAAMSLPQLAMTGSATRLATSAISAACASIS